MNYDEFVKSYYEIAKRALILAKKAMKNGLLSLEDEIDKEKADDRDILEYGLRFVIIGTDWEWIDKLLSNIIQQEKDEYLLMLKNIQKKTVFSIYEGWNPRIMYTHLNSLTDISLKDDEVRMFLENLGETIL